MRPFISPAILICLLTTHCAAAHRTRYEPPTVPLPPTFAHAPQPPEAPTALATPAWWREFHDPALDAVVELATARNADLAAAAIRVRRATLQARLTGGALLPTPSGSVSTGVTRRLSSGAPQVTETAGASIGLAWEVDLFGRLGAQRDAARFEAAATAEDRDATFLSLVGTATSLYWQLAVANERVALAEQSLADARRVRVLVEAQVGAGALSGLERAEAEQAVAAQESALSQARQLRTEAREAMRVLLDGATLEAEPQVLDAAPLPPVAAGLPAELLGRRPDLRAAELRLRRVLATGDAARARYYPALTLTGLLGTSSAALLHVLSNPVVTLGAGLTLPFLDVRAMRLEGTIAQTQQEEAVVLFRKSLYAALAEVESALSARTELAAQGDALRRARDAAVEADRRYEVRYRAGAVGLRAWLDAQERRRSAVLALSANRLARLQNHVTLHQAIGGSQQ